MIDPTTRVYVFLLGCVVLALIVNMVRTRKLQERYALLWLLAGVALTLAPLLIHAIDAAAYALGFDYPPALLLMVAVIGLMLIILQLSLTISHNAEHLKVLTQELGLLRQEVDSLQNTLDRGGVGTSATQDECAEQPPLSPSSGEEERAP